MPCGSGLRYAKEGGRSGLGCCIKRKMGPAVSTKMFLQSIGGIAGTVSRTGANQGLGILDKDVDAERWKTFVIVKLLLALEYEAYGIPERRLEHSLMIESVIRDALQIQALVIARQESLVDVFYCDVKPVK